MLIVTLGLSPVAPCRMVCSDAIMPIFVDAVPQKPWHDATLTVSQWAARHLAGLRRHPKGAK